MVIRFTCMHVWWPALRFLANIGKLYALVIYAYMHSNLGALARSSTAASVTQVYAVMTSYTAIRSGQMHDC